MALKNIPQAERLLSGTLTSYLSDVATTCVMSDPPSKFPTYIDLEPDSTTKKELVRAVAVSGSTVTIERSINGVTSDHAANATYKQKLTSRHWDAVSDALDSGYLMEDALRVLTRVSDTQFTITGYGASDDLTTKYAVGRYLRSNSSNSYVTQVTSSSYAAGTNKTTVNVADTLPTPLSTIEMAIGAEGGFAHLKVKATAAEVATGTDDTKIVTPLAAAPYGNSSMARQAIINGNFDVWQRGTTLTNPVVGAFLSDRFKIVAGMGTPPSTIVHSRQIITAGALPNSYYHYRINVNGAGTGAANDYYYIRHSVEHGTRNLAGNGKKVTLSFWAKSDIANKRIGIDFRQNYGTTGSPTSEEVINGTNWTLTSSWAKYTHTFTTNTLSGKTFGTDNNDGLLVDFWYVWNSTYDEYVGASTAETFVGSGNIDIAQVQLCAGDVALPFQPKSFEEELRACMRYYEKSYPYAIAPATTSISSGLMLGKVASNTIAVAERYGVFSYKIPKRISVTPVIYPFSTPANTSRVSASEGGGDLAANSGVTIYNNENSFIVYNNTGGTLTTDRLGVIFHFTADAEL